MRVGSLCQGIGGADLALEAHGHKIAWGAENAAGPLAVSAERWPGVPNHGDIKTIDWSRVEPIDILAAGYPCQPFSMAGLRQGADDDRHLWPAIRTAVEALGPRYIFLENVRGHLTLGAGTVIGDLAALGYVSTWGVLGSSDVGGCHRRQRLWIVAADARSTRRREISRRPSSDEGANGPEVDHVARCVGAGEVQAAGLTLLPTPTARDWKGRNQRNDATCLPGAINLLPTPQAKDATSGPDYAKKRGNGRVPSGDSLVTTFAKLAPTLHDFGKYTAAVARWAAIHGDPPAPTDEKSRLSPAFVEWMMGFPAGWVTDLDLSRTAQLKALGNAQQPQVAYAAFRLLADRLHEHSWHVDTTRDDEICDECGSERHYTGQPHCDA